MKTSIKLVIGLLVMSAFTACSSYNYYTAGLNTTKMGRYRSFAWMPPEHKGDKGRNSVADVKIKDAAVASLSGKGLKLQPNNPDLLVTYTAKVGQGAKDVYYSPYYGGGFYPWGGFGFGYGWGWGFRPYYYGFGMPYAYYGGATTVDKEHYKEGTIIIDLIDTRTKKIVWRGFGVGEVHHNPQKNIDELPKVVEGIIGQLQLNPANKS
ncbi:MAG: DUF4136 domain-containing protein [Mucilaginibacter sp.]